MREIVAQLWPEIAWIENLKLREQVTQVWIKVLERSPLQPEDLNQIPFTLLVPNCPVRFRRSRRRWSTSVEVSPSGPRSVTAQSPSSNG